MDDTKVAEVEEHLGLCGGEVRFRVGEAKLEGAEHEEE